MKLDDDVLRRAAEIVRDKQMEEMERIEQDMPEHIFSDEFEANMQELIQRVNRGEIKPYKVSMGWQYYARHGMVAVLMCALLTCIAAPQAVMAGYHKIVDVIETVVTEYTEYRYHVNDAANSELGEITFGYLPEGLEIVKERNTDSSYHVEYENGDKYFTMTQRLLTEDGSMTYIMDTENAELDSQYIYGEEVLLVYKDNTYNYVWLHENYHIRGISNLSSEEIIEILQNIKF